MGGGWRVAGGALIVALCACAGEQPTTRAALAADAGDAGAVVAVAAPLPASTDAGAAVGVDAGAAVVVDAGAAVVVDAGAARATAAAAEPATRNPQPATRNPQPKLHDRVLVKLPRRGMSKDEVRALVAGVVDAPIASLKVGPGSFALVAFAPTSPPRDAAAQAQLVEALRRSGRFAAVEGDRMMVPK